MAQYASPGNSPTLPARGRPRYNLSPSPSHNVSNRQRREKRLSSLADRLQDVCRSFAEQHSDHYYAQLSAIQCDINLIMRADPHATSPLDDSPETIAAQVAGIKEELLRKRPLLPDAQASFDSMGGKIYSKFVDEVNAAIEDRDRDLTLLMNNYQDGVAELRRTNQYKMQLAREEHALLSKTLRERLVQSVTQRRAKLMRDKEQLDIADSSALLLNPNQFSLGNPASPGGAQSNRKTRHTRLRDNEETADGNKRKRKAFEEIDGDSPGPSRIEFNPARDAKSRMNYTQFEAPLYSIERLFTVKDLDMNIDKAHRATFAHFSRIRAQNGYDSAAKNGKGRDGSKNDSAAAAALASLEAAEDIETFGPSPSLVHYLPQKASQSYHATRSQRISGLDVLSSAAASTTPFMVGMHAATGKTNPSAPGPAILDETFIAEDLELMQLGIGSSELQTLQQRSLDKTSVLSLGVGLENAATKDQTSSGHGDGAGGPGKATTVAMSTQASSSGMPMTKTNSTGGFSTSTVAPAGER